MKQHVTTIQIETEKSLKYVDQVEFAWNSTKINH